MGDLKDILNESVLRIDLGKHDLNYDEKKKKFTAFASDLRMNTWVSTVVLINPKTKGSRTFIRKSIDKDREGDVEGALYATTDGILLYVFND